MGLTKEQIAELRREVPARLRPAAGSTLRDSLPGAFSGDDAAAAIRERVAGLNRTLEAEDASLVADAAAPTEQDLRNGSLREDRDADEEITRLAKAGLLAGQAREGYFGRDKRAESVRKTKEAQKRAYQDMYLAATQALIDGLNDKIAGLDSKLSDLDNRIDTIEQNIFTPDEIAKFNALPKEQRFDAVKAAMLEKVKTGEMSQEAYDKWVSLNEERQATQIERDTLAEFRDQLKKDPEKALETTADGTAFKNPVAEQLAKKADEYRASQGLPPINRSNVAPQDIDDIRRLTVRGRGNAQLKQEKIESKQEKISGVSSSSDKSVSTKDIQSVTSQDIAEEHEKVGEFMKEYARIQLIKDLQERLAAEYEFVEKINNLPPDLMTVGFALQEEKEIAALFEAGHFDGLKTDNETKSASADHSQDRQTTPPAVTPSSGA